MSNEIIRLCCHAISLDRIFEGYVISSKEDLQGCISCCHAWKDHYLRAVQTHTQYDISGHPVCYRLSLLEWGDFDLFCLYFKPVDCIFFFVAFLHGPSFLSGRRYSSSQS